MKIGHLLESKDSLPANASWYKGKFPFAALKGDNRRFLYNPKTNTIVIGKLDPLSGQGLDSSHEKEFKDSGAPGSRHDYPLSGWVGIGGNYPNGVIHFAPPMITDGNEEVIGAGKKIIDLFKNSGASSGTVLRNFMKMGEQRLGVVSETFIQNQIKMVITESLLEPTPETIKMFTSFLKKKWAERSKERGSKPPKDLQGACKFSSLFAQQLFGGELRGNWHHQFLVLTNGKIIDPVPVPEIDDPQYHDEEFWMNPDHKDSLASCVPRVKEWVKEFMTLTEAKGPKKGIDKGSQKREKIGFATDDPDKYVGKWEAYDEPQGINSKAGKNQVKAESVIKEEVVRLYRGMNSGQEGNSYYTPDKDWARQFTQSGRDSEIKVIKYPRNRIFRNTILPKAYRLDDQDIEIMNDAWDAGYRAIWMDEGDNQPSSVYFMREKPLELSEGNSMGPEFSRGGNNSSTGLGAVPVIVEPPDLPRSLRSKKRYTGSKSPIAKVRQNVRKSTKNKVRKANSPVTEVFNDSSNVNIDWNEENGGIRGSFYVDNVGFDMLISRSGDSAKIDFAAHSMMDEVDLSNSDKMLVLNTVFSGVQDILNRYQDIKKVLIEAQTNSRAKLFNRMAKRLSDKWDVVANGNRVTMMKRSSVTEVFDDPSNAFPYKKTNNNTYEIDSGIENLEIVVGFEDISNYAPGLPPGVNAGMVTMDEGGMHLGIEPENVGMTRLETIKLFNSMMNIIREYVNDTDPDRIYFVAVKPMEGIYQRLIRRFVDTSKWNITVIKDVPIPMIGMKLNAYMIEKKNLVSEMVRLPMNKSMNNDYEVKDGEDIVGKAEVTDGIIEVFMVDVDEEHPGDFRGHVMSSMMGTIVRDADGLNANMSMQLEDPDDIEMKRFLERFGFRHVGQGVFRRTSGASTPPSVIY